MNSEEEIKMMIEQLQKETVEQEPETSGLIRGMINAFVIEGLAIAVLVGTGLILSLL